MVQTEAQRKKELHLSRVEEKGSVAFSTTSRSAWSVNDIKSSTVTAISLKVIPAINLHVMIDFSD